MLAAVLPVLVATLTPGTAVRAGSSRSLAFCIPCGAAALANLALNVLLCIPLGAALAAAGLGFAPAAGLGVLLSLSVEVAQLWIPGRVPNLADVVANGTGVALGVFAVRAKPIWFRASPGVSLTVFGALAVAVVAPAILLRPAVPPVAYWGPPPADVLRGTARLLATQVGPTVLLADGAVASAKAVPVSLRSREVGVSARVAPGARRLELFRAFDGRGREVLFLEADGDDLVVRYRTPAAAARLQNPAFRVAGAFPPSVDSVSVTALLGPAGVCVATTGTAVCPVPSAGSAWRLLMPLGVPPPLGPVLDWLWLAGWGLALAFAAPSGRVLGTLGVLAVVGLGGAARLSLVALPAVGMVALPAGLLLGLGIRRTRRRAVASHGAAVRGLPQAGPAGEG